MYIFSEGKRKEEEGGGWGIYYNCFKSCVAIGRNLDSAGNTATNKYSNVDRAKYWYFSVN
jgi:hypothetical protein